ncbi:MAG: type II toxin-antitoxin system RelE/ParE family toxin [Tannerellaceae bacterium]|jgi:plasmid stabilization system protein ParE|nr:type II toxin-antitoxin system RelE/ParE family toxin [Tannerellaceae bacterium]
MKIYNIHYSDSAEEDLNELYNVICYTYLAPITANKYVKGLNDIIRELEKNPEIYAIQTRPSLQQYGQNVRRINYKKMAIIYTIHGHVVYIHRIVAASLIAGL